MKKKRTFTPHEKANIVLEILRENETLTEISKKYDIAQPVLSRWERLYYRHPQTVTEVKTMTKDFFGNFLVYSGCIILYKYYKGVLDTGGDLSSTSSKNI